MPAFARVISRGALLFLSLLFFLPAASCGGPDYTAVVVDAETGEPIEGAVYLAVWWKEVGGRKASWEGTTTEIDEFQEGVTKADGKIHVPYYWSGTSLGGMRSLTVYKPGYVLWNSEFVFPDRKRREGYTTKKNTVLLEKWKQGFLHFDHSLLMSSATKGQIRSERYKKGDQLLFKSFDSHESDNPLSGLVSKSTLFRHLHHQSDHHFREQYFQRYHRRLQ